MRSDFATRNRSGRRYSLLLAIVLAAFAAQEMRASISVSASSISASIFAPDCSASGDPLKCYLSGILNFLDIAAAILGILLIAVIVAAVRIYRKTKENGKAGS